MNTAVIGFGGAGCRVLNLLIAQGFPADFIAVDNDVQSLCKCFAHKKILIGLDYTIKAMEKLDPEHIYSPAMRDAANSFLAGGASLRDALQNAKKTIWVAGLGGSFGSGVLPVALNDFIHCRKAHSETMVAVSLPFSWQGPVHRNNAHRTLLKLAENEQSKIHVVHSDDLLPKIGKAPVDYAFIRVSYEIANLVSGSPAIS